MFHVLSGGQAYFVKYNWSNAIFCPSMKRFVVGVWLLILLGFGELGELIDFFSCLVIFRI